ncbi:DUF3038 domain-containing protein [Cyanobacterium aponinum UTEX 3221]|uniref:DUF3038 domain-containing protein n=1 Tax=Cyanobacterium aponinum TaxID=379064 RepID=UPI002B4BAB5B|nr:DUF3038 domain-containing protein [Cyanobacterium aponinum]WRL38941.1 DUF3038 domain-containing protein [Cyanobacterium aponinum UTEX 3221]
MTDSNTELINQEKSDKSEITILKTLPDLILPPPSGMMRVQQQLDLLLLALEALQLGGSEYMLAIGKELELNPIIKNRLSLWRLRCSNPWRKCYTRESLSLAQVKALTLITVKCAKKFVLPIRQLLIAAQQMEDKGMPLENNFRLSEYFSRFRSHFLRRMNHRRAKVSIYASSPDELNKLALSLLEELLFYTGIRGEERLWVKIFDGEVLN